MAQPSFQSKLDYDVEYKASAEKVFDFWTLNQGNIPKASPEIVQKIELLEGTWKNEGSITEWTYKLSGENTLRSKAVFEKLDSEKKFLSNKAIDGDILGAQYKSFKCNLQMTPKDDGGSVASWTLEYEKLNENVQDPIAIREANILLNKAIDAYLAQT